MARDQELVSLSSFGNDLLVSGHFASLDSTDFFSNEIKGVPRKDLTVAPEDAPKRLTGPFKLSAWSTLASAASAASPEEPESLIVGGAPVRNVSLVVGDQNGLYDDLKVMPIPVAGSAKTGGSLLVAPVRKEEGQPMLFLPAESDKEVSFPKDTTAVPLSELTKELDTSKGKVGAAAVDSYVLSGDLENFFGIKGLTGKLYSFKSDEKKPDGKDKKGEKETKKEKDGEDDTPEKKPDEVDTEVKDEKPTDEKKEKPDEKKEKPDDKKDGEKKDEKKKDDKDTPVDEKVKLKDMDSPLSILFPEIENKAVEKLPIKNLAFTYSNKAKDSLFPAGLRLEGDLELKDGLQFMSDALKNMFGNEKAAELPKVLRVSAHLAEERDWSKKPKIGGMVLQASLGDMKLPKWDFLEFNTVGFELSVRKEGAEKKKDDKEKDDKKKEDKKGDEEGKEKKDDDQEDKEDSSSKPTEGAPQDAAAIESTEVKEDPPAESEGTVTKKTEKKETTEDPKSEESKGKTKDDKDKEKKEKKEWKVGYGLFGKLRLIQLPKSKLPLEGRYWVRMGDWKEENKDNKKDKKDKKDKDGKGGKEGKDDKEGKGEEGKGKPDDPADKPDTEKKDKKDEKTEEKGKGKEKNQGGKKYELVIQTGKWKDFCGISNLSMKEAELRAFFKPEEFKDTCTLAVTGALEFAQGSLDKTDKKKEDGKEEGKDDKKGEEAKKVEKDERKEEAKKKEGGKEVEKKEKKDKDEEEKPKNATLKIKGQLSRKDYHFDAKVGDLKLDSILKIYAQISGAKPSTEEVKGHDFTFEELHLNIARKLKKKKADKEKDKKDSEKKDGEKKEGKEIKEKGEQEDGDDKKENDQEVEKPEKVEKEDNKNEVAKKEKAKGKKEEEEEAKWAFELSGKVSFNDVKSVHGLVKIDSTGLTIQGGLEDYKIKDIDLEIKEAKIDVFIGAKPDEGKNKNQKKIESKPSDKDEKAVVKPADSDKSKDVTNDTSKDNIIAYNRASKFAIKGKVEFQKVPITVAFMTERKETNAKSKKTSEREWVLYGVYGGELTLSSICGDLGESAIGKMQLKNIALIAASGKNKTLEDLNVLKYPVNKGISLCATIPQIQEINSLAKQEVDGLVLAATVYKKLDLRIHLPKAFDISFSPTVSLNEIGIGIEISRNPSLIVEGVLKMLMESGQDPLELEGKVRAGLVSVGAQVAAKSPWVNPFNISKEVKIANFRVEFEINYVTLMAAGPSIIGLEGGIEAGELCAGAAMVVSHYPDNQLLTANISKVDLIEIIHVAGQVADIQVLKDIGGGEDTFVFTDASMYISTGATIADKEYPRGISAGGKLTAFGKSAEFDLSIGAAGLDFQGYIDNFSLGPLVVQSASGESRAGMVVLMTKDQQVIKVDGMVTCFNIGLVTLIDIQMGTDTPSFDAYIAVKLTEAFQVSLHATVDDFHEVKDLAAIKGLYFHAQIKGDLFDMICESIKNMLKSIEELGTQGIEAMQDIIGAKIAEKQAEMNDMAKKVEGAKAKVDANRTKRQEGIDKEAEKRKEAEDEIKQLRDDVKNAINNRDKVERQLKEKVEKAELKRDSLIAEKTKEYNDKLEKAKQEEKANRDELARLRRQQETKYGINFLEKVNLARGAYDEKKAVENKSWKEVDWLHQQKLAANWLTVGYWATRHEAAKLGHEIVKAATAVYLESANALDATANSDVFKALVTGIAEAENGVKRAVNGIDNLIKGGGVDGFVRAFVDTEEARVQKAINDLHAMQNENSDLQKTIRNAQAILNKRGPELEKEIAEADEAIKQIEEDAELGQLTRDYEYQLKVHDQVHNIIQEMQAGLETLKENWHKGMEELKKVVDEVQKAIASVFHVERIEVGVHTHALVNDKPLMFTFVGTVGGKRFEIKAEWSPGKALSDLYKTVTNEILKL
ncbi:uncharacterized protein ASPGLDRAFT_29331 [Aspergillus glaucus CBS 516.65]|uniref:Uncharacterized protein n=1 Tax=Aspergillus glaucus CBS 516.65 TaxID=1160497 RepID=A0A1L9V7Z9_ASPGL|nr:hypothetical protein ASPGLDRAFT_29331 [Aspergillus glaucus CBS 516.65]OJJ80050.1 hypothetical protein ASPGLDRAFT_29331 [Aspergillus glaucus CBS 516.65]